MRRYFPRLRARGRLCQADLARAFIGTCITVSPRTSATALGHLRLNRFLPPERLSMCFNFTTTTIESDPFVSRNVS